VNAGSEKLFCIDLTEGGDELPGTQVLQAFWHNSFANMTLDPACALQVRMQDPVPGAACCGRLNQ
jgi:hypothetical protein